MKLSSLVSGYYMWLASVSIPNVQEPKMATKIVYTESVHTRKPYGLGSFLFDVFMAAITGGMWLIWVFVREMRNR